MDLPEEEKNRIINYVKENNVEDLRPFTNILKSQNIINTFGDNLLLIAMRHESREVFDFLLSIDYIDIDYPLERRLPNRFGHTALITSLIDRKSKVTNIDSYFISRLIDKGADVSVLHKAVVRNLVFVAKLLIENGVDVNAKNEEGNAPLHLSVECTTAFNSTEMTAMLLSCGADTLMKDSFGHTPFDLSLIWGCEQIQELLFLYTFDQYTEYEIKGSVLLKLAKDHRALFLQIYKNIVTVDLNCDLELDHLSYFLFIMDMECLVVLVENFPEVVRPTLLKKLDYGTCGGHITKPVMNNLDYISTSNLRKDLIYFLNNTESTFLVDYVILNKANSMDLSEITELYCFMLSHGLHITEYDVQAVYQRFGYCELFKIMLHMDIEQDRDKYATGDALPTLCYNFDLDFHTICYEAETVDNLLYYYNDSLVKGYCLDFGDDSVVNKVKSMPTVPLLMELARNAFRKYFVEKFHINNSRQFYTLLKKLPISIVHEKIITLETRLY